MSTEPAAPPRRPSAIDDPAAVRRQGAWALAAAAAMLYFGFAKTSIFADSFGAQVLKGTLRYGGIATLVAAAGLFTGAKWGVLVDGVVGMVAGAGIGLAAVSMSLVGFNIQIALLLVFSYLFISSGWRQFKAFVYSGDDAAPPDSTLPGGP